MLLAPVSCFSELVERSLGDFQPFWNLRFRQESFQHMHRSALRTFRQMDGKVSTRGHFGTGNFRHEEFSAPWKFRHGIFWHLNISTHGYFGTLQSNMDVLAQTFRHLCYFTKMSMCQNVPVPKCSCVKMFLCQKFLVPKSPHVKTFPC